MASDNVCQTKKPTLKGHTNTQNHPTEWEYDEIVHNSRKRASASDNKPKNPTQSSMERSNNNYTNGTHRQTHKKTTTVSVVDH